MWQDAHDTYLESRVLSADPVELIRMLYQSATRGVENARRHLAAGDIAARARSISHASAVLMELAGALDHDRGGEVSANLARLYDYMLRRLTEANLRQQDAPLAEVLGLLGTLSEGWNAVEEQAVEAAPPAPKPEKGDDGGSWTQWAPDASSDTNSEASWSSYSYGNSGNQPSPEPQESIDSSSSLGSLAAAVSSPDTTAAWESPVLDPPPSASGSSPWEPVAAYGNSWAQLAAQETASCSSHDWSL